MKELQKRIKNFTKNYNLDTEPEIRALDLVSEVGEVSKEILKASNYGTKRAEYDEEIVKELGDTFFSLTVLANSLNVDLEEAVDVVLDKYERRLQKGSAGSEND